MTQELPAKMFCARCGHFLGAADGAYFESRPCPKCRWNTIAWRGDVWPERPRPQSFRETVVLKANDALLPNITL